jgi:ABC-type dipeptide/oligopeptide/nickel transport system permease subunit
MRLRHSLFIGAVIGAILGAIPGIALFTLQWDSVVIRVLRVIDWIPERITDYLHTNIFGGPPEERFFILVPTVFCFWLLSGLLAGSLLWTIVQRRCAGTTRSEGRANSR